MFASFDIRASHAKPFLMWTASSVVSFSDLKPLRSKDTAVHVHGVIDVIFQCGGTMTQEIKHLGCF
jgi:hypothetical protein